MTTGSAAFRTMMQHITPQLQHRGFSRRGNAFSKVVAGNAEVVEFQRIPDAATSAYSFFVILGVVSGIVHSFETGLSRLPGTFRDYHWSARLGDLLPQPVSWGWEIRDARDASEMAQGILEALEQHGFKLLEEMVDDARLLDAWTRTLNKSKGGDIRPLIRLSVLATAHGRPDLASAAIAKLREECEGLPCASVVNTHAEKLARWNRHPSQQTTGQG